MGKARRFRIALFLILAVLFAGCWDRRELESSSQAVSLGLDAGERGRLKITARIAVISGIQPGSRGVKDRGLASELITAEASTINQALMVLNAGMSRRVDFRHLKAVMVGEELARRGLEPVVMEMLRSSEIRQTVLFIQTRGPALEVLAANRPVGEVNPAKLDEDYILQAKHLHEAPPIRLQQFLIRMGAPGGDPFATAQGINPTVAEGGLAPGGSQASAVPGTVPRGGGNPVEQVGTAIYRRDRLTGFLNVDETQMLLALRGEMGKAYITFPDPVNPDYEVTMRFHQENKPKVQVGFRSGKPHVKVRLLFEGELLAAPSGEDYVPPPARIRLERAAVEYANRTLRATIAKLKEWKADPVGFGNHYRSQFLTQAEWEAFDWRKRAEDLQVEFTVDMRLRRYALRTGADKPEGRQE